jgi:hypothetical protein
LTRKESFTREEGLTREEDLMRKEGLTCEERLMRCAVNSGRKF